MIRRNGRLNGFVTPNSITGSTTTLSSRLGRTTYAQAGSRSKTSRMLVNYSTSSTETTWTSRGDEESRILEVEELTEWRYGGLGHWAFPSFYFLLVGTRSSTNGIGTGFTTSGNPVDWRWSFPVRRKVTLDVLIGCWTYGIVWACMRDGFLCSCFYLYLAAREFCPIRGGWCNGVVKYAWLGLPDSHVRCPVLGNHQPYIDIVTET